MSLPEDNTAITCTECMEVIPAGGDVVKKLRKTFCTKCWIFHCTFRFRKRIFELSKLNKEKGSQVNLRLAHKESVLLWYDGSPSSVAFVNLIREALCAEKIQDSEKHLPFPFNFIVFVILESDQIGGPGSVTRQKKHLQELQNWLQLMQQELNTVIPLFVSSIELSMGSLEERNITGIKNIVNINTYQTLQDMAINLNCVNETTLEDLSSPFNEDLNVQLEAVISNIKTKTSQKDFLSIIKFNLMRTVAHNLSVTKLMVPEDQTALAIKMFTIMSLGRGAQLAEQMGFINRMVFQEKVITIARPLIDFPSDDLREYLKCISQEYKQGLFSDSSVKNRKMKIDSLERQCDNFIVELQSGFGSTVPTLAKIGEKLCPSVSSRGEDLSGKQCKLCKRLEEESDLDDLCYGCSNISKDMKEPELLRNLLERESS